MLRCITSFQSIILKTRSRDTPSVIARAQISINYRTRFAFNCLSARLDAHCLRIFLAVNNETSNQIFISRLIFQKDKKSHFIGLSLPFSVYRNDYSSRNSIIPRNFSRLANYFAIVVPSMFIQAGSADSRADERWESFSLFRRSKRRQAYVTDESWLIAASCNAKYDSTS